MQYARPAINRLPGQTLVATYVFFNFGENLVHGRIVIGPLDEPTQKADEFLVRGRCTRQIVPGTVCHAALALLLLARFHSRGTPTATLAQRFCCGWIGVADFLRDGGE